MLTFGKKQKPGQEKVQAGTGEGKGSNRWASSSLVLFVKSQRRILLAFTALLIVLFAGVWYYRNYVPLPEIDTMSEDEAIGYQIDRLSGTPPPPTATAEEKAKYYSLLAYYSLESNNLERAAQAYLAKEKAVPEKVDYIDYFKLAAIYKELKKNAEALAALDKSEKALPLQDNEASGYSRTEMLEQIAAMRQELVQ